MQILQVPLKPTVTATQVGDARAPSSQQHRLGREDVTKFALKHQGRGHTHIYHHRHSSLGTCVSEDCQNGHSQVTLQPHAQWSPSHQRTLARRDGPPSSAAWKAVAIALKINPKTSRSFITSSLDMKMNPWPSRAQRVASCRARPSRCCSALRQDPVSHGPHGAWSLCEGGRLCFEDSRC